MLADWCGILKSNLKFKEMKGNIILIKKDLPLLEKICEDRFNGTYRIKETHKLAYTIEIDFGDIQDVFSLGQILESEKWASTCS